MEVSKALHPGSNSLGIDVTNLWINRLIGDKGYPNDGDWSGAKYLDRWSEWLTNGQPRPVPSCLTFSTLKHRKQNHQLTPSGLIGPVTLPFAKLIPVR